MHVTFIRIRIHSITMRWQWAIRRLFQDIFRRLCAMAWKKNTLSLAAIASLLIFFFFFSNFFAATTAAIAVIIHSQWLIHSSTIQIKSFNQNKYKWHSDLGYHQIPFFFRCRRIFNYFRTRTFKIRSWIDDYFVLPLIICLSAYATHLFIARPFLI